MVEPRRFGSKSVRLIIAVNILVFLGWVFYGRSLFMLENFLVSWDSLTQGRWWTALTSEFSHNLLWHLMLNMLVLLSFGPLIEQLLGSKFFIKFYIGAAICASLAHAFVSEYFIDEPSLPALGASGAISGLVMLFSFIFPKAKILLFGIIPMPAMFGALMFVGLDVWGLYAQAEGGGLPIGHGAHLGGAFAGVAAYFLFVRARLRNRDLSL